MTAVRPVSRSAGFAETRGRIVSASYQLFAERAVRDVAMDEVAVASGVAKATLYRHFPTKEDLVLAFLERREKTWTFGIVRDGAIARSNDPEGCLLAIFDVFDEWFQRDDFEACTFINVLLETGTGHPLGRACADYLGNIRAMVSGLADDAGILERDEFAWSWHILMKGCIVQAAEGDRLAAGRARRMAERLIADYRPK